MLAAFNIKAGLVPVIPVRKGKEERDGGQGRQGNGQHKLDEDPQLAGSVNLSGFDDFIGNRGLEKCPHDDDIERGTAQGENQGPVGVFQPQDLGVDHVGGQQAAVKNHGNENQVCVDFPKPEIRPGKHIAHGGDQGQAQQGSDHRNADGSQESHDNGGDSVGIPQVPDILVCFRGPFRRNKAVPDFSDGCFRREGDDDDKDHGDYAQQGQKNKQKAVGNIGAAVDGIEAFHSAAGDGKIAGFCHFLFSLLSQNSALSRSTFRTIVLATTMVRQPRTD